MAANLHSLKRYLSMVYCDTRQISLGWSNLKWLMVLIVFFIACTKIKPVERSKSRANGNTANSSTIDDPDMKSDSEPAENPHPAENPEPETKPQSQAEIPEPTPNPSSKDPKKKKKWVYVSHDDGSLQSFQVGADNRSLRVETKKENVIEGELGPIAIHKKSKVIFVGVRDKDVVANNKIYMADLDANDGRLLNGLAIKIGFNPVYLALNEDENILLASSYHQHNVTIFRLSADSKIQVTEGNEPDPRHFKTVASSEQAHSVVEGPNREYVIAPSTALSILQVFPYSPAKFELGKTPMTVDAREGFEPRHLAFHPENRILYVVNQRGVSVSSYHFESGKLENEQCYPLVVGFGNDKAKCFSGVPDKNDEDSPLYKLTGADVHLTPDGGFLYASTRDHFKNVSKKRDAISVFKIDDEGSLTLVEHKPTASFPRDFGMDPGGDFIIVAAQRADKLQFFSINKTTGALNLENSYGSKEGPAWVEITQF